MMGNLNSGIVSPYESVTDVEKLISSNYTFDAELRYEGVSYTFGLVPVFRFVVLDVIKPDITFYMLPNTFNSVVPKLVNGIIKGTFGFEKNGDIIGIKLIKRTPVFVEDFVNKYKNYQFKEGEDVIVSNSIVRGDYWARSTYLYNWGVDSIGQNHHYILGCSDYFFYCLPLNDEVIEYCKTRGGFDVSYTQNIVYLPMDEWKKYQDLIDKAIMCWNR